MTWYAGLRNFSVDQFVRENLAKASIFLNDVMNEITPIRTHQIFVILSEKTIESFFNTVDTYND